MNFKEQMDADISAVFLNPNEFGESCTIDGKSVTCILDSDADGALSGDMDGVFVQTKRLYVAEGELAKEPTQGKIIVIDGDSYTCLSISREMGMLNITVVENSS